MCIAVENGTEIMVYVTSDQRMTNFRLTHLRALL